MHVSLGKRDFDACLGEGVVDAGVQAVHEPSAVMGTFGPAQKLEVQRRVAEFAKTDPRFWILGRQRIGTYLIYQNGLYLLDVRTLPEAPSCSSFVGESLSPGGKLSLNISTGAHHFSASAPSSALASAHRTLWPTSLRSHRGQ